MSKEEKLYTTDEILDIQNQIITDLEYDLKRAKSPKSIRQNKSALRYHKSIRHQLTKYNEST